MQLDDDQVDKQCKSTCDIVACGTVMAKMGLTGSAPRGNDAVQSAETVWTVQQTQNPGLYLVY